MHIFAVRWLSAIEIAESGELFRNFALNLTANVDNSLQVLAKEFLIIPLHRKDVLEDHHSSVTVTRHLVVVIKA